jgi:hypothetical protein
MDGVHELRFLREMALGDVLAIARLAMFEAHRTGGRGIRTHRTASLELPDQRLLVALGQKKKKPSSPSCVGAGHSPVSPGTVLPGGSGRRSSEARQHLLGLGAL